MHQEKIPPFSLKSFREEYSQSSSRNAFTKAAYGFTGAWLLGIPLTILLLQPLSNGHITFDSVKAFFLLSLIFSIVAKNYKPVLLAVIAGAALLYGSTLLSQALGF